MLDIAAERLVGIDDLVEMLTRALREQRTVDQRMQVELLADSARWPTDSGVWALGAAVAVIASDPEGVSEAVDGLIAALDDLGR